MKEIKRCSVCKKRLKSNSTSGYCRIHWRESTEFKKWVNDYQKEYYNSDVYKKHQKKYQSSEKCKKRKKQYYQENKERIKEYNKQWRKKNNEQKTMVCT